MFRWFGLMTHQKNFKESVWEVNRNNKGEIKWTKR